MRAWVLLAPLVVAGCMGEMPFAPKSAPVETAVDAAVAEAAAPAEIAPEEIAAVFEQDAEGAQTPAPRKGLFAFLKKTEPAPEPLVSEAADITVLSDEGAPQDGDTLVAEAILTPQAPRTRRGFAALFAPKTLGAETAEPAPAQDEADVVAEAEAAADESAPDADQPVTPRRGLAALFARKTDAPEALAEAAGEETPEEISEEISEEITLAAATPAPRKGIGALFKGGGSGARKAAAVPAFDPSRVLQFGTLEQVCGLARKELGRKVDSYGATWTLYDTNPDADGPRTHFLVGARNGCAYQFTAALVLFGTPELHETHRYGPGSDGLNYNATDRAYEKVKSSVCGVGKGKHCPPAKVDKLASRAGFLTAYNSFGGAQTWMTVFFDNGAVIANALRAP